MKLLLSAFFAVALPVSAMACPWATNSYKIGANNQQFLIKFDVKCSEVRLSYLTSPSEFDLVPVSKKGRKWEAVLSKSTALSFGQYGRSVMLRHEGRQERLSVSKQ